MTFDRETANQIGAMTSRRAATIPRFLPSASKIGLASTCAFPWSPHAGRWPKREMSAFAAFGTAVHAVAERQITGQPIDLVAVADEFKLGAADTKKFLLCAQNVLDWIAACPNPLQSEIAVAYHVADGTGRKMRRNGPRDYSDQRRGELSGTLDIIEILPNGRPIVWDIKTGHGARGENPRETHQLLFGGLAVARMLKAPGAGVGFLHVDELGVTPDSVELDELDLGAIASGLRTMIDSIPTSVPKPGPHCTDSYCPIVATCPATLATLAAISTAAQPTMPFSVEITSPEHAAHTRVRLQMVREAANHVESALKAYVKKKQNAAWKAYVDDNPGAEHFVAIRADVRGHAGIEIEPGLMYGYREQERETLDISRPGAYAELVRLLGQEVVDNACSIETSKAALIRAGKLKPKKIEAVVDALRELGAIRITKFDKPEEYKLRATHHQEISK